MKIVINKCYGGFGGISYTAAKLLIDRGWKVSDGFTEDGGDYVDKDAKILLWRKEYSIIESNVSRTDKDLVEVVEILGGDADGTYSSYSVVEIPDDVDWQIDEYDGLEWIAEKHRTWR